MMTLIPTPVVSALAATFCFALVSSSASVEWHRIDDFEGFAPGSPVSEASTWQQPIGMDSATVVRLTEGNLVAQIEPGQALVTAGGPDSASIPEGGQGMIFLKFRALPSSKFWGGVMGMASTPLVEESRMEASVLLGRTTEGPRPNATFLVPNRGKDVPLLQNRGGMNRAYEGRPEIKPEIWYSLWITIDNSRDELRFFIQGGDFENRTELTHFRDADQRFFGFNKPGALELRYFMIACPIDSDGNSPRTIQVDDVNFMLQAPTSAIAGAR